MSRATPRLRFALLPAVFLLLAGPTRAQMAPDSARLVLKLAAARLLSSTYEVEVEHRYGQRFSVSLLPRVVAGPAQNFDASSNARTSNDQVRGYGLGLSPRFYLPNTGTEGTALSGLYISLKAEYQHLRLRYQQEAWGEDVAPDGLLYYTFRPRDLAETINRYGGAASVGYQCQVFHPRLRLDTSILFNTLSSHSSAGEVSRYRSAPGDYGQSGSFWTLGVGVGFVVK